VTRRATGSGSGRDSFGEEDGMGRGDRARVRWAHDRERKKKSAEKRKAAERGAARKAAKK
jgi:hypothetical protein